MSLAKQVCDLRIVVNGAVCNLIIFDLLANMLGILATISLTGLKMVNQLTESCSLTIVYQ
jgi:hypothetical protein